MAFDVKEAVEEIKGLVVQGQKRNDELTERGQKMDERLEELQKQFGDMGEKLQEANQRAEAETKAREALEMALAKMPENGSGDPEMKGNAEYRANFKHFLRKGAEAGVLETMDLEGEALVKMLDTADDKAEREIKALAVGSNADGGFLAPVDMMRGITERIFETSPMRSAATVISTANEAVEYIIDDQEAESETAGEVDAVNNTATPQIGKLVIPTHEQRAQPLATQKILDDAGLNVEAWLNRKVADKFRRQENKWFLTGDGIDKPTGFLTKGEWTDPEVYERNALATIETTTNDDLTDADDLIALQTLLLEEYQPGAAWMMNRRTWGNKVLVLKDLQGQYLINPQLIFQGVQLQLLGKPVVLAGDMPIVADGNKAVAYGDFGEGYVVVDRIGIRILRDPYTQKPFVKFYTTKRVGGDVVNYQAIKILKIQ